MNIVSKTLIGLVAASAMSVTISLAQNQLDFAVMSDIHIMDPALLKSEGAAFDDYIAHDRKLLQQGPQLLQAAISRVLRQERRPGFVLIPGDLTKDGELSSHRLLADSLLRPLRDAGIKVFVIPGNHDVNNPHARCFDGDSAYRTATVGPEEFAEIYADYGYGEAIARDPNSLSYVVQLNDSLRLLALDACRYQDNDFEEDVCVTGGRIQDGTMAFIKQQVAAAHEDGCAVMSMMHHGLVKHWKWQDKVMAEYLVDGWKDMAKTFGSLGIHVVFTGHFHSQDISSYGRGKDKVYDVETGSMVSHPMPLRFVTLTDNHRLDISTERMCDSGLLKDSEAMEAEALRYAKTGIGSIVRSILPAGVPEDVVAQGCEVLGEAYVAHLAGDESMPEGYLSSLKRACKALRPYSKKYAFVLGRLGRYFHQDDGPADNDVALEF